ncbi:hypothetical protein ATL41_0259 [Flavimobilis soli]|uniref:Uncharacterized protein n=1 Tax=Flavimobilis soli TaxID=442709 RepID=A0A2A9EBB6_9MICO|nr:hypothetical protein [Flavimobilis soli]PFG35565.1 hypothetical protein ATL41_0259 [Flavimobilis soli]
MLVGTLYGTGVLGERVEESSGGSLSATATLLAPAGTAFSIWSVIEVLAVVVLAGTAGIAVFLARRLRGRIGVALAATWGLAWIAVGRAATEPESTVTAVAAAVAALVVVIAAVVFRGRADRSRRVLL